MKRIRRCIALMGVACLLAFGSVGDSQVPGDVVGPWTIRDQTDFAVLFSLLDSQSAWKSFALTDLTFRPVISSSQSRVYFGGVDLHPSLVATGVSAMGGDGLSADEQAMGAGHQAFGYIHVVGSGCATPPDQVFLSRSPRQLSKSSPPKNRILTATQYEFLIWVLEGMSGQGQVAQLLALGDWFENQNSLFIRNFEITQVGAELQLDFYFWEQLLPGQLETVRSVQATILATGTFGQVVVK